MLKPCVDPCRKQKRFIFTCVPLIFHLSEKIFLWNYFCVWERACAHVCRCRGGEDDVRSPDIWVLWPELGSARAGCALYTKSSLQLLYLIHFNTGRMPLVFATLIILEYPQVMCGSTFVGEPLNPQERTCSSVEQFVLREWASGFHYFCPPPQQETRGTWLAWFGRLCFSWNLANQRATLYIDHL